MSNLLIDDYPILVLPTLATEIGLNESIVLQQMHYWLKKSNYNYDGRHWIYNSFPEWQKHFPFWSVMTIKRAVYSLEKQNLLYVGNYNKAKFDKTKWYSINYEKLEGMKRPSYQNDTTSVSKRNDGVYQNDTTNTRDYTEIYSERDRDDVSHVFKYISNNLEIIQSPLKAQQLEEAIKDFKDNKLEIVIVATDYCRENSKGVNYLIKVLENWSKDGVDTKEKAISKVKPRNNKEDDYLAKKKQELLGG
ncbi:DnaD domain protein [Staphylococcus epidermidis]|nr:DnaD domain protein [Staphylococcus epidermidis]MDH8813694.1 DnaD domain protein [Staphylococcus epidermidis]MDH8904800.1 DnaD domain protein [Staphylococcus epidermidis]MDH8905731.1 DnaD domain protein [Staphylococcus epidermidis]MDH8911613.1 DnaD domain protein [Staphylococcus epidermidis]